MNANVHFSAAIPPRSVSRASCELAYQHRGIEIVMSGYAISEALSNLQDKRPEAVEVALGLLDGIVFAGEPPQALTERMRTSYRTRRTYRSSPGRCGPRRTCSSRATPKTWVNSTARTLVTASS